MQYLITKTSEIMKRAWEIRREVAKEMNVKVSEISMSESLKMAWEEAKSPKEPYVALKVRDRLNLLTGTATVKYVSEHQHGKIYLVGIEYDEYITSSPYEKVSHHEELTVFPTEDGGTFIDRDHRENRKTERGRKRVCKVVDLVCKVEEETEETYVSKVKALTTKFDEVIDDLDERTVKTIYVMLTQFGGNAWVKDDKARIYINNGFDFVETEKLEVIKTNVWVGKNKFDWCKWNVNGFQTYDVFRHAKDDKAYCSQLAQGKIDIELYYDVIANKFVYTDDTFKVAETVIEKIKAAR